MNRFEAIARFEASLASVAPEQRRPLVAAFNAAIASSADEEAAFYIIRLTDKRETLNTLAGTAISAAVGILGASMLYSYTEATTAVSGAFLLASVSFGFGAGKLLTAVDMTAIMRGLENTVNDWLDFDEPEPAEPEQRRRVFDPQEGRTLVSKYDFSNDELLILANLRPGTPITRPALEAAGFTGLTGYIGTDTRLAVLQGELERMGWANRVGKELQMSRAGIAAAHAHAE